jgi:hypothetical protein
MHHLDVSSVATANSLITRIGNRFRRTHESNRRAIDGRGKERLKIGAVVLFSAPVA